MPTLLLLLLSLFCTGYSQSIPIPDFHAIGESAAMFGEDDDLSVLIETTTEPTTTTSTATETPTTSLVGILPVNQTIRVIDDVPVKEVSATPPNDPQPLSDTPSEPTTQPPPPPPSPSGYDFPSTTSSGSSFVPPAPITTTEVPPPPPPPVPNSPAPTASTLPPPPPVANPPTTSSPVPSPPQPHPVPNPHPIISPSPPQSDGDSPPVVPDLLFVVDASGSMKTSWQRHLQCVETIARVAASRAKIGVIVYSSKYKHRLYIPFAHYDAATLNSMIQALPFHGGVTNTGQALNEAVRVLQRERPQRVSVITMTDGYSWDALDRGSAQIRSIPGTTTYAVALEDAVVKKELQILAGSTERVFMQADCCERLAGVLTSGFRKNPESTTAPETTTAPWHSVPPQSSNRYPSAAIGNEDETHAHFDDRLFTVDGTTSDDTTAHFDSSSITPQKSWAPQQNYLPIPRRNQTEQCSLDVVFAFDSTSHAGLPALLAASQQLLHSRVFKKRTIRIGAVKFSDAMDSRIVFPLDEASRVSLDSILKIANHRGVEQALFLAAGLMRDAAQVRPTKRIVIVLSDVFDSSRAGRALAALQSLDASVFVLHSTQMATITSHSFPGAVGLTTSVVSHEDISKVEQEVENLAQMCARRMRRI